MTEEGETLTVDSSEYNYFPSGMEVRVDNQRLKEDNKYQTRSVRDISWNDAKYDVPNRLSTVQVYTNENIDGWKEIGFANTRENDVITFEEDE
jgi:hypothetical protein